MADFLQLAAVYTWPAQMDDASDSVHLYLTLFDIGKGEGKNEENNYFLVVNLA